MKTTLLDKTIIILLILFFILTSYFSLLNNVYYDDIIVITIGLLLLLKSYGSEKKIASRLYFVFFVLLSLIIVFSFFFNKTIYIKSLLIYLKVLILLFIPFFVHYNNGGKERIVRWLIILSIPNLIYGFVQIIKTYIYHITLIGKYELINGKYYYRIMGFTEHPLFYSLLIVGLLIYILYFYKGKTKWIFILLLLLLCGFTHSSFSIVMSALCIIYKLITNNKKINLLIMNNYKKILLFMLSFFIFIIYYYMKSETYTIRFISTKSFFDHLSFITLFIGNGVGSYSQYGLSEAYLIRILFETGIIGMIPFIVIIYENIKKQALQMNNSGLLILFIFILNCLINEGYMIPFIIFIPLLCISNIDSEACNEKNCDN